MVFQDSGGREFDLPRHFHYSGVMPNGVSTINIVKTADARHGASILWSLLVERIKRFDKHQRAGLHLDIFVGAPLMARVDEAYRCRGWGGCEHEDLPALAAQLVALVTWPHG